MPFDGTQYLPTTSSKFSNFFKFWYQPTMFVEEPMPLQILREARKIIKDQRHWTVGRYEATSYYRGRRITQRCAVGALRTAQMKLYAAEHDLATAKAIAFHAATQKISFWSERYSTLELINDNISHQEVMMIFDAAITEAVSNN